MAGRVDGKVALVTGAARGQGRAHALRLAEEGADVIALDLCGQIATVDYAMATSEDLEATARDVEALGRRVVAAEADVRDGDGLIAVVGNAVEALGRLDIVVANAGIAANAPGHLLSERAWQDVIDVNLTGVWHTAKAAIPHLVAGGRGGSMVFTSSIGGVKGMANIANYVAAKHGVLGLMKVLAVELAPHMIRVNAVLPTNVDTPMIQNASVYRLFLPEHPDPGRDEFADASMAMNALPVPWVDPSDVANAALFLASNEARYITGAALPVDAGSLLL